MQPYQQAGDKLRKQSELPVDILKGAASLAGSGAIANKILPLLNQHVPVNLMQKGLSKINPKLGSFMEQAQDMGFGVDEIREFLQKKVQPPEPPKREEEKEHPNITQAKNLETQYPHVIKALMGIIQQGQTPQAAAAILKTHSQFGKDVKKIEKETGKNFVDLILELLGPQNPLQQQGQQQPDAQMVAPEQMQQTGSQPQQPYQQQPQGGVDPQLMQLLQNIQSGIKNLRGKGG